MLAKEDIYASIKKIGARHGDLRIKPITKMPSGLEKKPEAVLAYGEASNHAHRFNPTQATVYEKKGKTYFTVDVKDGAVLTHEEHKATPIPQGSYEIINEQEYSPFEEEIKIVAD